MELPEFYTACDVLLSSSLVKFVQRRVCKFFSVDGVLEVERNVVHEERFKLLLEPGETLSGGHVDVESAQLGFLLGVDVRNQLERVHVD